MTPAPVPTTGARTIRIVELGRGLAALAVVVFHANVAGPLFGAPRWRWPAVGEHGVDFFFVLSGFIIFTAHQRDLGLPGSVQSYLLKRAIRLLPLLWLVVLICTVVKGAVGRGPDVPTVLGSMLLWPSLAATVPTVVWTLRHELLFYLAFTALIWRPRLGAWLFGGWALLVIGQALAVLAGAPVTGWASLLLSSFTLDFLFGMGVALAWERGWVRPGWSIVLVAGTVLTAALAAEELLGLRRMGATDYISVVAAWWTPLLGLLFAALLWGMLAIETLVRVPRWGIALGGASYAIYLIHTSVNSVAQRVAVHLPATVREAGGGHLLLIAAGVAGGFALTRLVDDPLRHRLRALALPGRARQGRSE